MSETGHAKNVASFETLVNFVTTLGSAYNPAKGTLTVANLTVLLTTAKTSLTDLQDKFSDWKDITNQRELAFESTNSLSTRAVNSFAVSGAEKLNIDDAKSFLRKFRGTRAKTKPEPNTASEAVKTHSASQTSYDNKVEHFSQLVSILENNSNYKPNETDLQTATLNTVLEDLRAKNTSVVNSSVSLSNSRLSRNQILYKAETGLVDIAKDVKTYVKSVFGASSPQYKQISGLVFRKNVR
jgi:hypothetical protein